MKFSDVFEVLKLEEMFYLFKLFLIMVLFLIVFVIFMGVLIGYVFLCFNFFGKSVVKFILDFLMVFLEFVFGLVLFFFFGRIFVGEVLSDFGVRVVFIKFGIVVV